MHIVQSVACALFRVSYTFMLTIKLSNKSVVKLSLS